MHRDLEGIEFEAGGGRAASWLGGFLLGLLPVAILAAAARLLART